MEELNAAANMNEFADIQEEMLITDTDNQETEQTQVEETQEAKTPVAADNSKQDVSTTKAFSERLNKEKERIKAEESKQYSDLIHALKGLGFEGSPQEMALRIKADMEGVEYEELKAQEEARQKNA